MKTVCVQGLGFVGAAISVALANANDQMSHPVFNVIGLDLENETGKQRVDFINKGVFPFATNDHELKEATQLD